MSSSELLLFRETEVDDVLGVFPSVLRGFSVQDDYHVIISPVVVVGGETGPSWFRYARLDTEVVGVIEEFIRVDPGLHPGGSVPLLDFQSVLFLAD